MTHPTDEELDALDAKLASQIGDDVAVIFDHEYLFKQSRAAITALRAQLAAASARADQAEAALAAQIEADARIADDCVAMRERQIADERAKALLRVDVRQIMRWQAGKVQAAAIAAAIRNQPRALAALESAPRVNETPKSDHDSADVLTALPAAVAKALEEAAGHKEQLDIWAQEIMEDLAFADVLKIESYEDKIEAHGVIGRGIVEVLRSLIPKSGTDALRQAVQAEREARAVIAETMHEKSWPDIIAAAIRARGDA